MTDWLTHSQTTWNQEMPAQLIRNAINQKTRRSTSKYQQRRKYCWGNIIDLREYCRSELYAWSWKHSQWHSGSFVLPLYALPPSTGNHDIILGLSLCHIFMFCRVQWKMWPASHIHRISSDHQINQLGQMTFHSSKYDVVTKARFMICCEQYVFTFHSCLLYIDFFLKHSWSKFWTFCLANVKYSIPNICLSGLVGPFVGKGWVNSKGACLNTSQHNTVLHKLVESNI